MMKATQKIYVLSLKTFEFLALTFTNFQQLKTDGGVTVNLAAALP